MSPPGGIGPDRTAFVTIGVALFTLTAVAFIRPPLLVDIGDALDLSATGLGALLSVFAFGRLLADLPAGRAAERCAPNRLISMSAALAAVGSVMTGLAPGPVVLYSAAFVLGIASTITITTSVTVFSAAPMRRRGMSLSMFAGAMLAGQAVGPALGGAAGSVLDWRGAFIVGGVIAAAVGGAVLLRPIPVVVAAVTGATPGGEDHVPPRVLAVLYLLPALQFSVGAALIQTLIPLVGSEQLGFGPGLVGAAIGIGGVFRFIAAIASGLVSDRVSRKAALVPGVFLQTAGVAVFAVADGPVAWWSTIVLLTLGSVIVNVGSTILADLSEAGGRLGRRLGAFRFTGDAAFLFAPVVTGVLFERYGRAWASLPLLALGLAMTLATIVVVPETRVVRRTGG